MPRDARTPPRQRHLRPDDVRRALLHLVPLDDIVERATMLLQEEASLFACAVA
jgi:hypothetical protein